MVASTYNTNQSTVSLERNDMFAQSSALYGRINARKKTSPLLLIVPVAALVMVGGIVIATSTPHRAIAPAQTAPAAIAAPTTVSPTQSDAQSPVAAKSVTVEHKTKTTARTTTPTIVAVRHTAPIKVAKTISRPNVSSAQAATPTESAPAISNASSMPLSITPAPTTETAAPAQTVTPPVTDPAPTSAPSPQG